MLFILTNIKFEIYHHDCREAHMLVAPFVHPIRYTYAVALLKIYNVIKRDMPNMILKFKLIQPHIPRNLFCASNILTLKIGFRLPKKGKKQLE